MQPLSPETAFTSVRWVPVRNGNGSDAPAFGLVRVTGSGTDGVTDVDQPNADGQQVWVAGYGGVDAGVVGVATSDFPAWALYDSGDGTPAVGETWGAGNGSWKLRKDKAGFRICGTPDTTAGIVPVERAVALPSDFENLTSDYTISSSSTWLDTGLEIDLPDPGQYLLNGAVYVNGQNSMSALQYILSRLYDSTAGSVVPRSGTTTMIGGYQSAGPTWSAYGNPSWSVVYTTSAACTLKLQVQRSGGTWVYSSISATPDPDSGFGQTFIEYVKIG